MVNELEIEIDGVKVTVPQGSTVMDAARKLGLFIPHFCYHPHLSIAANCRMCLIDVEKAPKPLPACATPATPGLKVWTRSKKAVEAQQSVMNFILINHPLDCPICDQGGECALQDVAMGYGATESAFAEEKRVVKNKDLGPLISTDMTRCIYCTRCVRFGQEVAGLAELGVAGRGEHSEIMTFMSSAVNSELSGNVIDLCPVGALTSKPFYYLARSWELSRRLSVSAHDSLGSNLIVQTKLGRVYRVLPFENPDINECWLSDRDRFSYEALKDEHRLTTPMLKKEGRLLPISWEEAFSELVRRLSPQSGQTSLGTLVHPMATLEELFLLKCLHTHLGSTALHAYLGHQDLRIAKTRKSNWLGMSLSELSQRDQVLIIGSFLRHEHPLLSARVRRLAHSGMRIHRLSVMSEDWLMPIETDHAVDPTEWVYFLAHLVSAVASLRSETLDVELQSWVSMPQYGHYADQVLSLAQQLVLAKAPAVFMGDFADKHPDASVLHRLMSYLCRLLNNAVLGFLGTGANYVAASALSLCAETHPLDQDLSVLCLFNAEPAYDCALSAAQKVSLDRAGFVVNFSCYYDPQDQRSDLMLPLAAFLETEGSFINIEGRLQSTRPTVRPLGEIKPGWKILKVLLERLGYTRAAAYTSCAAIREDIACLSDLPAVLDNNYVSAHLPLSVVCPGPEVSGRSYRYLSYTPVYMTDPIVRRATSLQKTALSTTCEIHLSPISARALGVSEGDWLRVVQEEHSVDLPVHIQSSMTDGAVLLPVHHATSFLLNCYGLVHLERI